MGMTAYRRIFLMVVDSLGTGGVEEAPAFGDIMGRGPVLCASV